MDNETMSLADLIKGLTNLAQLLEAQGRYASCVDVWVDGKPLRDIKLRDSGDGFDNLEVNLASVVVE